MIQIIDVTRPGWEGWKQATSPSRKEQVGQKGMISCLEFQPGYTTEGAGIYAAGSFFGSVGLYDERQGSMGNIPAQLFPNNPLLRGRGITHLQFNPTNANLLYIGARRSSAILEFDIRQPNYPAQVFPRSLNTDQRLSFDVRHNHLVTGDENGRISIFDLAHPQHEVKESINWAIPAYQFQVQEGPGAIGSAQFHPTLPILMTASGSRIHDPLGDSAAPDESFLKLWSLPYKQRLCSET
ncbi:hypothetical protein DSO57_1012373 [Entomophthora muscae]|uniref:Uncharacterized protein n=1 Tax=Entomophthora muscae TaxID=34485 RepID=A0ACC2TH93_9FUNG|nr:hypothetical protein DSO57_1012373 [Entomophthora muscae]